MAFGVRYQLDGETFWLAKDGTMIKSAVGDESVPADAATFDSQDEASVAASGDQVLQTTELPAIPVAPPALPPSDNTDIAALQSRVSSLESSLASAQIAIAALTPPPGMRYMTVAI